MTQICQKGNCSSSTRLPSSFYVAIVRYPIKITIFVTLAKWLAYPILPRSAKWANGKKEVIIMRPYRRVVKDWAKTADREELNAVLNSAIFTPDELKYINMRIIQGKSFKLIAIDCQLSKSGMAKIADKVAKKIYKAITK